MKRLAICLLIVLPLLACGRFGYEPIYHHDGEDGDARDGLETDLDIWPDAGDEGADPGDPGLDAGDPGIDGGTDAADLVDAGDPGPVDAGGDDSTDGADDGGDPGTDSGPDAGNDGGDPGADTGPDAGDQDPDPCRTVESYVETFSVISTAFVEVPGSEIEFTPAHANESWLVMVSSAMGSNFSGAAEVETNYTINDVEMGIGGIRPNDPWMAGAWQHFALVTGTTEPQRVVVGLREGLDGFQATILRLRVIAFPLPATADAHYITSELVQPVSAAVWQTYQNLDVNPMIPGRYLILSSVSASENPGSNSIGVRLVDPQGEYWPQANPLVLDHLAHFTNNRYPWRSFFVARAQDLSGPVRYRIEAIGSNPGGSEIFYSRILALRVSSFSTFQSTEYWPPVSATTSTPVSVSNLPAQPSPSGCPLVAIQSMFVYTNSSDSTYYASEYLVDGSPVASFSNSFQTGFCMPFGVFHLLPGDTSYQLLNQFYLSVDGEAQARESVIHVLGL